MIEVKPSPKKPFSGNHLFKYYRHSIFAIVIIISLTSIIYYASHKTNVVTNNNFSSATNKPNSTINMSLNNKGSESMDQLGTSIPSEGTLKTIYELPAKQPVVYITIDDGWYPNQEVLKIMQQYHLPITTFLIEQAAEEHPDFWHKFINAGGHIEDHSFNHPFLTHLSQPDQIDQISKPIDYFRQYGPPPDELRPPYGDFNSDVVKAAKDSGIKHFVMWDAEMKNSTFTTRSGHELKSGDIILLHWEPGLDQELIKLLNIIKKQNLAVADLTQELNGEPLTICWLKTPLPIFKSTPNINTRATGITGKTVASVSKVTTGGKEPVKKLTTKK